MFPNDKLQLRNTILYFLHVHPGTYAKIKIVFKNQVCLIVDHCYYNIKRYNSTFNSMQGRCTLYYLLEHILS